MPPSSDSDFFEKELQFTQGSLLSLVLAILRSNDEVGLRTPSSFGEGHPTPWAPASFSTSIQCTRSIVASAERIHQL